MSDIDRSFSDKHHAETYVRELLEEYALSEPPTTRDEIDCDLEHANGEIHEAVKQLRKEDAETITIHELDELMSFVLWRDALEMLGQEYVQNMVDEALPS